MWQMGQQIGLADMYNVITRISCCHGLMAIYQRYTLVIIIVAFEPCPDAYNIGTV